MKPLSCRGFIAIRLNVQRMAGSARMDSPDKPGSDDFIYNQTLIVIAALVAAIHGQVLASHRFRVGGQPVSTANSTRNRQQWVAA